MGTNYGKKRSLEEAADAVDDYVEPRDCFVWYINNQWGWQSFSATGDTPCAHYVAHQIGLSARSGVRCRLNYIVRVSDLVRRLGDPIAAIDAKPGDVWARQKGTRRSGGGNEPTSHCGMVVSADTTAGAQPKITIKHCSSGQRRVAVDDWGKRFGAGGYFYRVPAREVTVEFQRNLQRLVRGFAYELPHLGRLTRL